jgi:hypothetical protein
VPPSAATFSFAHRAVDLGESPPGCTIFRFFRARHHYRGLAEDDAERVEVSLQHLLVDARVTFPASLRLGKVEELVLISSLVAEDVANLSRLGTLRALGDMPPTITCFASIVAAHRQDSGLLVKFVSAIPNSSHAASASRPTSASSPRALGRWRSRA